MPVDDNQQDLDILRGLIDCLHLYVRKNGHNAPQQGSALVACLSTDEVRSFQETRQAMLEKLEQGMLGLSYDYLGIKLRIAVVLAREARGEGFDGVGLREQLEDAVAGAGRADGATKGDETGVAPPWPGQYRRSHATKA